MNEILNEINKDEEEGENVSMNVEEAPVQEAPHNQVKPIRHLKTILKKLNQRIRKRMFNVDMEQPEETTMIQEFLNNLKAPTRCRSPCCSFLNSTGYKL